MTDDVLIAAHVIPDHYGRGRAHAWVSPSHVSIWVLIWELERTVNDAERAARAYDVSASEMQAALAWYRRFKDLIDAIILLKRDEWKWDVPEGDVEALRRFQGLADAPSES